MGLNKKGFTVFEVLIMVIVISLGILAIIVALNNGTTFIQKTRERTIAINLAREGIEAVYQIRDTNRQRRAGKKENCRLKKDPLIASTDCSIDSWITSGNYILQTTSTGGQQYFILSGSINTGLDLTNGVDISDLQYSLCQSTENNNRYACPGQTASSKEGQFFRQIRGIGLFLKDKPQAGGEKITCNNGASAECGNDTAKEYRFCSQVAYIGRGQGKVELCGILTNFK